MLLIIMITQQLRTFEIAKQNKKSISTVFRQKYLILKLQSMDLQMAQKQVLSKRLRK